MIKFRLFWLLSVLLFSSCAQITSLNLKKHQFGQLPTKIIWIQVAGLQEEHIAMLKYSYQSSGDKLLSKTSYVSVKLGSTISLKLDQHLIQVL